VVGSEPEIYFYAQRRSATGYIYTYPLMESQPYAISMQREMIGEIEANKPEYLVLVLYGNSWLARDSSDTEILSWAARYARESYEMAGLIQTLKDGQVLYYWGDEAGEHQGPLQQLLMIYKRKPGLENAPSSAN
jgi:hypothetical protein